MTLCYIATLPYCFIATLLHCYTSTFLHCYFATSSSCCTGADVIIAGTGRKASLPANTFNCDSFCIFPQFYQLPTANCLMTSNFPNPNPSCQRQLPKSKSQMPNNAIKFLDKLRNIGSCNSCGAQAWEGPCCGNRRGEIWLEYKYRVGG